MTHLHNPEGRPDSARQVQVLIVDDHRSFREKLQLFINTLDGYACSRTASSGKAALDTIRDCAPDVALIDYSLPDSDAIKLIRQLTREVPRLRCLVVSGHNDSSFARRALDQGALGYVIKGEPLELKDALAAVMAGRIYLAKVLRTE
jgi:DNA-binding NarL/FixJ family response regulator